MAKPYRDGHTISDHVDPTHEQWARPLLTRLEMLNGFDYKSVLGNDTNLDEVKLTTWTAPCGCELTYIWHRNSDQDTRVHHPLIQHNVCDDHAVHKGNASSHFSALRNLN